MKQSPPAKPVKIASAIQAHPRREGMAEALAAQIPGCEVVYDPDPYGYPSPWRTYRTALEATPADATHRLILQEDTALCRNFAAAAEAAVAARPGRLVAFFVPGHWELGSRVLEACRRDEAWALLDNFRFCPAVALCWPAGMIGELLEFVDGKKWPETFRADDEIIGRYLHESRQWAYATVPSLVEHPDQVDSLMSVHRAKQGLDPNRLAACWIGDCSECDAAQIDWSTGPT